MLRSFFGNSIENFGLPSEFFFGGGADGGGRNEPIDNYLS